MAAGKLRVVAGTAASDIKSESSALFARFERRELSIEEYLDARTNEAVAQYEGSFLPIESHGSKYAERAARDGSSSG
jgi:hypothetical protein